MAEEKELLKPSDVAARLGLTTGRVYQLIASGALPAMRLGGALRIPKAAWEAWLEQQRRQAIAAAKAARRQAGKPRGASS